jgi:hypothetical protein
MRGWQCSEVAPEQTGVKSLMALAMSDQVHLAGVGKQEADKFIPITSELPVIEEAQKTAEL